MTTKEEKIHRHCIENKLTLSLAESCTGGALAARLTSLPGASAYFLGSVVAYSNDLKVKLLGVKPETLAAHGAVSGEVVAEMVKGILTVTGSDYAIAISGIAGPDGGTQQKPVGTMWAAIETRGQKPRVWRFHVDGDRHTVIHTTVDILLGELASLISID